MIPEPNLDDRGFNEILEEAIRLIPQYCPEWTNFNKADPGITLLELFSWMTESVVYRLNRVPEKNFLAFLNLMGIDLRPPQPARAVATFAVSPKTDKVMIPRGTKVGTAASDGREQQTFEVESHLVAINNRLAAVYSQHHDSFTDHSGAAGGVQAEGFPVFEGVRYQERFLYIGDERLEKFNESARLTLILDAPGHNAGYPSMFDWEYWNGERWVELEPAEVDLPRNAVAFAGVAQMGRTVVAEKESCWIRGRLKHVPQDPSETLLDVVRLSLEVPGDALRPESASLNAEETFFLTVDLDKNFAPFGKEPKIDTTFYLRSDAAFAQPDTVVELEVMLSDPTVAEVARPSDDLALTWEYFNGRMWHQLGRSSRLPSKWRNDFAFRDETDQFSRNGRVFFERPHDMQPTDVNGEVGFWVRVRVAGGDYGVPGSYELDGDVWVWKDERPLRPPRLKSLAVRFHEHEHFPQHFFAYGDFEYQDYSRNVREEYEPFQPFNVLAEENPALYLGFELPFPNDAMQLYLAVEEELDLRARGELSGATAQRERTVVWEFWNGSRWTDLIPIDGTHGFTQSGFLEFTGPADHRKVKRFGETLYWIRARLEMGGYDHVPCLRGVLLNSAYALHLETFQAEVLGSSEGTPHQSFGFARHPVLPGEQLWVVEKAAPLGQDLQRLQADFGEQGVQDAPDRGGTLVRWKRVENFFDSDAISRHYTRDVVTDEIRFGDGINGMVPPKGDRNIVAMVYQVGGGPDGNVPAAAVTVLKNKIAWLDGVTNLLPASGGAALETIDEVKRRGPHFLKSRNRAITAEDFEWLALQSTGSVGRVKCLPSRQREGEVTVVVVPRVPPDHPDFFKKPLPTPILLNKVKAFLDERRMLTTIVHVVRPRFVELSLIIDLRRHTRVGGDRVKRNVEAALRRYLHPLQGGREASGWPFGRNVYKADLYHVIEELEGVDFVERVRIIDAAENREVEQVKLAEHELPFLVGVEVIERSLER
jgi:uncharacterized phage protein gp47/JayE